MPQEELSRLEDKITQIHDSEKQPFASPEAHAVPAGTLAHTKPQTIWEQGLGFRVNPKPRSSKRTLPYCVEDGSTDTLNPKP